MPDFSDNGIYQLPDMTMESLRKGGDSTVIGWIREALAEGDRINKSDPMYDRMEIGMNYVAGMGAGQTGYAPGGTQGRPGYLPTTNINESRKAVQAHVSALTDLRPVFAYKATNPAFQLQADLLNKLTVAWWISSMADLELGDCIKYALSAGTGDLITEWDPHAGFYGDIRLSARDARDTIPIRPAIHTRSIHAWEGLILRESHTVNALAGLYPTQAPLFRPSTDSLLSTLMGRVRQFASRLVSPAADTLSGLDVPAAASRVRSGECLLYRTYLTDRTRNLTKNPIPMGTPGASWAYVVPPGGYLYPFKRLIVSTPEALLYDGPNPYWHGTYPVSRLKLWSLPWHFLGVGLLNDLIPLADSINDSTRDIELGVKQWMNRQKVYDRSAVSESFMRTYDARKPGASVKLNTQGAKAGFTLLDGVPPQVLAIAMENREWMTQKFNELSGTPNMQELLALRQLPSADTIARYWEALTPEIRQEGRQVEAFLRDVAEQAKVLRFQYESNARRVAILGDAGTLLEDFDFDPNNMVPALNPGDPGYSIDLDANKPRDERAKAFHRAVVFTIAPNSILAVNATESKMIRLQLARGGLYDAWSLAESLEIPNYGQPPAIPLPPLKPEVAMQEYMAALQAMTINPADMTAATTLQKYQMDPATGRLLELRVPMTVTERLQAQNMLGLGMSESPAGRKASGSAPPSVEQKSDGRTTVTESKHSAGPNSDNS